jgi:O-methyltransferase involved in polyketide biosynthesis
VAEGLLPYLDDEAKASLLAAVLITARAIPASG